MTRVASSLPVTLRAGCKVNLNLFITGVRQDGWHELDSLFVPLAEPHDALHLLPADGPGLTVVCDTPGIDPERNTLTRAYELFAAAGGFATRLKTGLAVRLDKGIPHGAGLGGGSADAAALLAWLNATSGRPLDADALRAVAVRVGADVPFFLHNVPCRATGVGEILTPCETGLAGWRLVLACPPERVATAWAYRAFDERTETLTACRARTIRRAALGAGWPGLSLVNDFEPVVFAAYPVVRACKEHLLQCGAQGAVMSGSGCAVAGLFRREAAADAALKACLSRYGAAWAHTFS
jgi:4-diphosphocytidyl-2-C-methyl-D-erythritol kinase